MSYNREYYLKNKEKYLEATRRYIAKKRAEKNEEWLSERNEYMKNYYKNNPEQKEKKNEYNRKYREEHREYFKEKTKECHKKYNNQLCIYNGETLTMNALVLRFRRRGIKHPTIEAKKYLLDK